MNNASFPFPSKSNLLSHPDAGKWPLLKKRKIQGAIDIGSNKITCLIGHARHPEKDYVEILGCGWVKSEGIRAGDFSNAPLARKAILSAYHEAVKQAGIAPKRKEFAVNLSCGDPYATYISSSVALGGEEVSNREIKQLLESAKRAYGHGPHANGDRLVRLFPIGYTLDGQSEIETPLGQPCYQLDSKFLAVMASEQPYRTLTKSLEQNNLYPVPHLPAAFASGLSALTPQEREFGTIIIDLGGGTSSWAFFRANKPEGIGQVKWGGNYITHCLMEKYGLSFAKAENFKTRYGCSPFSLADETEILLPAEAHFEEKKTTRSEISCAVVTPLQRILSLLLEDISSLLGPFRKKAPPPWKKIVLTGGSALLEGIDIQARALFGVECRIAGPGHITGIPEKLQDLTPSLTCAAGLLTWRLGADRYFGHTGLQGIQRDEGIIERILHFIQSTE